MARVAGWGGVFESPLADWPIAVVIGFVLFGAWVATRLVKATPQSDAVRRMPGFVVGLCGLLIWFLVPGLVAVSVSGGATEYDDPMMLRGLVVGFFAGIVALAGFAFADSGSSGPVRPHPQREHEATIMPGRRS